LYQMAEPPVKKPNKRPIIVCASRRVDVVGNPEQLIPMLAAIENQGTVSYKNPMRTDQVCVRSLSNKDVDIIAWFSKDYSNLIESWSDKLNLYKHHFSFTINGPARSHLEPGLETSLEARLAQIEWLVEKSKALGEDPNHSIMIHIDPISVYRIVGEDKDVDTLEHVPELFAQMARFGLNRVHLSFTQINSFIRTKSRLRKLEKYIIVKELSTEEQQELFDRRILPHSRKFGISVQTCTALNLENAFQGSCLGWQDVENITGRTIGPVVKTSKGERHCTCYPFYDIGEKSVPCKHGCRYCFSNPKIYDW